MVISGDSDGVVPTLSSRSWVESLGLPVKQALRPWVDAATGEVRPTATGAKGWRATDGQPAAATCVLPCAVLF